MKGALLVLALLVTRELTFETHEACPMFSAAFSSMALGSKTLLNSTLSLVDATDAENEAIGRIQDCFNEAGFDDKLLNIKSMASGDPGETGWHSCGLRSCLYSFSSLLDFHHLE
uniref:Uncharacterized protein n=1 Tax=Ovis aries TaxID=9940 RepID=A0AC11BMW2_SHEEP